MTQITKEQIMAQLERLRDMCKTAGASMPANQRKAYTTVKGYLVALKRDYPEAFRLILMELDLAKAEVMADEELARAAALTDRMEPRAEDVVATTPKSTLPPVVE